MDPLSIAASVTGLLTAGAQLASLLQRFIDAPSIAQTVGVEIHHFVVVLSQLQPFVAGSSSANQSRTSMIEVQQIQIILTGCVLTFSELQAAVAGLSKGFAGNVGIRGRVRWALAESSINQLVQRLRDHKSSLTLILTILTCNSTSEAVNSMSELRGLLERFIQRNDELFTRVLELEMESPIPRQNSIMNASIRSRNSYRLAFETVLFDSRLYKRVLRNTALSTTGSRPASGNWSVLSGFSLSDVSNISVFHLAVCPADLSNPECYTPTSSHLQGAPSVKHHEKITTLPAPEIASRNFISSTPLHIAATGGDLFSVRVLLGSGADVNAEDRFQHTPLHMAAQQGHTETVRALLESGASIDSRDLMGRTPLHLAAKKSCSETARVLLELGADNQALDVSHRTPFDYAVLDETMHILLGAIKVPDRTPLNSNERVLRNNRVDMMVTGVVRQSRGGAGSASGSGASGSLLYDTSEN